MFLTGNMGFRVLSLGYRVGVGREQGNILGLCKDNGKEHGNY